MTPSVFQSFQHVTSHPAKKQQPQTPLYIKIPRTEAIKIKQEKMSEEKGNIVCEDCDKKTQKHLPEASTSSEGMPCQEAYAAVTKCMKENNGQISPCVKEWDGFKACHEKRHASK